MAARGRVGRGGRNEWARAHFLFALEFSGTTTAAYDSMALDLDKIRALADRVAASHGLAVVEVEYLGSPKHRALRIYIEKDAASRAKLAVEKTADGDELKLPEHVSGNQLDQLAGIKVEDCQVFSDDFGTVLDVEELVPGAEYTLEVSSPGLDRKLHGHDDYVRFAGSLAKLRTIEPIQGNSHWQGRIANVTDETLDLDLSTAKKRKNKKEAATGEKVTIAFSNILKANLVPEI
jgi:ribosome maturation factor RimP